MNIAQNICDAIDIIVNRAIEQATFAKTIVAQVLECVDAAAGLYKVKYQESIYQATCDNLELQYKKGTDVYVLIPEGDFSKAKKILGAVSVLGADYREQAERDAEFDYIGGDLIVDNHEVDLHSYRMEMIDIPVNVDIEAATESFTQSEYFIFGAEFKTAIPRENQYYGNYGLILTLEFEDDITREYVLDVDHMVGQPYNQTKYTRQITAFPIEGAQFKGVKSVIAFSQKFPNKDTSKPADIFIRNIELCGANKNGYVQENGTLNILTPQGILIKDVESLPLQAEVRIRGKALDPANHNLSFYWFKENAGIDAEQEKYNQYGGQGWECLNDYIPLGEGKVDWLSGTNTYQVKREDCLTRETKYKCVGIYNDNVVLENTVIIKNYDAVELTIESSKGTQFYYNQGHTTLTCLVDKQENLDYTYKWVMVNSFCNYKELLETLEDNDRYAETVDALEYVKGQLANFKIFKEHACILEDFAAINAYFKAKFELENQEETFTYDDFCNYAESYIKDNSLNRIEKNKITNIPAKSIVDFVEYKCAVYDADKNLIGTASIRLTNSFDDKGVYGLVIHGGDQVFKYDESGRSPAHHTMENPMEILPLTFSIYDENGDRIEEDYDEVLSYSEWRIPLFNTMLKTSGGDDEIDYSVVEDCYELEFDIVSNFNRNASKNQILLEVGFRGKVLTAQTNFTFLKEGDNGTNGTNFVCKIVPNLPIGGYDTFPEPWVIFNGPESPGVINYPVRDNTNQWFRVQLWENDICILNSVSSVGEFDIKWSMLSNKYNHYTSDLQFIQVNAAGEFSAEFIVDQLIAPNLNGYANIAKVEVTYKNKKYFATQPIAAIIKRFEEYDIALNGGYNRVVYSSDGLRPQYDSIHPFEIICKYQENDTWIDISMASTKIYYNWYTTGRVYNKSIKDWEDCNLLKRIISVDTNYNQAFYQPLDPYDGQCVTAAIVVDVTTDGDYPWVGTLYYPIHFMLNRFGIAAVNDWDGNSITLDEEGGMLLSPQVGAGKKDDNNRFTGVVIGTVDDKSDSKKETGLVGYSAGQRSIFLDAETGKAEFGVQGKGRIILDPTKDTAVIQSGNYSESKKTGMMIDFTTPEIKYGSGKFKVDANGVLNATDGIFSGTIHASGGNIGNWQILNNRLEALDAQGNTTIYLGTNGLKVGDKFRVDENGALHASGASIDGHGTFSGNIYAEDGEFKGVVYARDGEFTGVIHAKDGEFSGTITATGGSIGGIQIGRNDGLKGVGWSISPSGITCTNITMGGKTFIPSTIYDNNVWWYPDGIPDSSSVTCITSLNPLYDSTGQYVTGFSPSKVTFKYNGSQTKYTCIATTS